MLVLLLNYLPWIVLAGFIWLIVRFYSKYKEDRPKLVKRVGQAFIAFFVTELVLMVMSAGFLPKNEAPKFFTPEQTEAPDTVTIQDRLRKPAKDAKQSEADFQKLVDWRADKAERERVKTEKDNVETVDK